MKRILTIFLALLMIVSLAACGKTGNDISGRGNSTSEATAGNDPRSGSASDSGGQSGLYNSGEIKAKSGAELEALMHE